MSVRHNFLLAAGFVAFVGCSTTAERPTSQPLIAVTVPYDTHGKREAFVDCEPPYSFYVLLTNVSRKPVRLWQEWVSWGYYSLELEFVDSSGKSHSFKKKPTNFLANPPASFFLQPNESVVWDVKLTSSVWQDLSWIPEETEIKGRLKAIYKVDADEDSKEFGVWTGRADSEFCDFSIHRVRNEPK